MSEHTPGQTRPSILDYSESDFEYPEEYKYWLDNAIAKLEQENGDLLEALEAALLHLDASICECGFELRETDAADTLREAIAKARGK